MIFYNEKIQENNKFVCFVLSKQWLRNSTLLTLNIQMVFHSFFIFTDILTQLKLKFVFLRQTLLYSIYFLN